MKYQTGKYYHDNNGNKRLVVSTTGCTVVNGVACPIISKGPTGLLLEHTVDGAAASIALVLRDEVVEFKFDWSCLPAWAKEIAMDEDGRWHFCTHTLNESRHCWISSGGICGSIPPEYYPVYSGDWKDSRRVRPTTTQ